VVIVRESGRLAEMEQPSLLREVGKIAWLFAKVVGIVLVVMAILIPISRRSQTAGITVFWVLAFAGQIFICGYLNYQSKKRDLKRDEGGASGTRPQDGREAITRPERVAVWTQMRVFWPCARRFARDPILQQALRHHHEGTPD
jgi:hypothetical protein